MLDIRKLLVTVILTTGLWGILLVVMEICLVLLLGVLFLRMVNLFISVIAFRVILGLVLLVLISIIVKVLKVRVLLASLVIVKLLLISVVGMLVQGCLLGQEEVGKLVHSAHIFDFYLASLCDQDFSFLLNCCGIWANWLSLLRSLASFPPSILGLVPVRHPPISLIRVGTRLIVCLDEVLRRRRGRTHFSLSHGLIRKCLHLLHVLINFNYVLK
jgi:hypothetical protein